MIHIIKRIHKIMGLFKGIKNIALWLQWKYICWRIFDNKKRDKRK